MSVLYLLLGCSSLLKVAVWQILAFMLRYDNYFAAECDKITLFSFFLIFVTQRPCFLWFLYK